MNEIMELEQIQAMPTAELGHRCKLEEERYKKLKLNDPRFLYELFLRAVTKNDQEAWVVLYYLFERLLGQWIKSQKSFYVTNSEVDELVNIAYARFNHSLKGLSPELFRGRFPDTRAIMGFLRRVAQTTVLDEAKKAGRQRPELNLELDENILETVGSHPDFNFSDWQNGLYLQIKKHLITKEEQVVFVTTYILGLKTGEIVANFKDYFPNFSANKIYKTRLRIMRRLQKDDKLKLYLD